MNSKLLIILPLCFMLIGCCNYLETEEKKTIKQTATEIVEKIEEDSIKAEEERTRTPKDMNNYNVYVWTDEETGVQYIVYSYKSGYGGMGGITPRLNSDGTVMVVTR